MSSYPLTSAEMKAIAGVVQMNCVEANRFAIERRKQGLMSDETSRRQLVDCWQSTYVKANENCGQEFRDLIKCVSNNERRSLKCLRLRNVFEACYVEKVMVPEEKERKKQEI